MKNKRILGKKHGIQYISHDITHKKKDVKLYYCLTSFEVRGGIEPP